jgi:hypothetical protein
VRRALPWLLAVAAAALVVAGVALLWLANLRPAGWTAYTSSDEPLSAYPAGTGGWLLGRRPGGRRSAAAG